MQLVMTLLVRDEEDVLDANIRFHRAQGVDFFICTDNKSEDSTPDIIKRYVDEGIAHYIYEPADDYNQTAWVTRMARLAATDFDADWVINNDADEFWWPKEGDLKRTFSGVEVEFTTLVAPRHDFVSVVDEQGSFFTDMIYRKTRSLNIFGKPLLPKVAHRAHPEVVVQQGNHRAEVPGEGKSRSDLIDIFHFPIRRYEQFINKIVKGGQAYKRNKSVDATVGGTWRRLYKEYQRDGLKSFYGKESLSRQELEAGLQGGELVFEHRLSNYLRDLES